MVKKIMVENFGVEKAVVEVSFNCPCLYGTILAIRIESVLQILFMVRKYYILTMTSTCEFDQRDCSQTTQRIGC